MFDTGRKKAHIKIGISLDIVADEKDTAGGSPPELRSDLQN